MGKAFDITEHLSDVTLKSTTRQLLSKIGGDGFDKIDVRKLRPAAEGKNFYHINPEDVNAIAASIELLGGIQENLVVKPISGTDEYEVIAGNTRRMAVMQLVNEGKEQYAMVPCKVVNESIDSIEEELILILTNFTQRIRNDAEKMHEIERLRSLIVDYRKQHKGVFTGNTQKVIPDILNISKSKVGRLDNINRNLTDGLKEEFEKGKMNVSVANELAGLPPRKQEEFHQYMKETGNSVSVEEVRQEKQKETQIAKTAEPAEEMDEEGGKVLSDGMQGERKESPVAMTEANENEFAVSENELAYISKMRVERWIKYTDDLESWLLVKHKEGLFSTIANIIENELKYKDVEQELLIAKKLCTELSNIVSDYKKHILEQVDILEPVKKIYWDWD